MTLGKFLSVLLLLATPFISFSQNPKIFVGQKPAWVTANTIVSHQPNAREIKDGYFLKHSEIQVHVEEKKTYYRMVREIVSEKGIQNASEISVSFDPTFEKLTFHEIVIWRNNKPQNRLVLNNFKIIADEKELSKFIYRGSYNAFLILSDIRKGDRIDISYTLEGRNPVFGNNFSKFYYAQEYSPISHLYTSILASKNRDLNFRYFNNAPALKKSVHGSLVKYEWDLYNLKAIEYEENEPSWFDIFPYVQVSDYKSWLEVAHWAATVNPPSLVFTGELSERVQRIKVKYAANSELMFREAVRMVQNEVRYMGVEMGKYSHQANKPQKVFGQRFGDCKDKSLLLVSVLKSLGFSANIALVNTREGNYIDKYIPSPQVFDHVVVKALVQGKEVWVDATSSYQGGEGADIYFPDYGKALLIQAGTNKLIHIPKSTPGRRQVTERFIVKDHSSPVKLEVVSVYNRNTADNMRSFMAAESLEEKEKSYLEYYADTYPGIVQTDSLVIQDDLAKNILTVTENYEIPGFFTQDSVTGVFRAGFYADYIGGRLPKISPNRKHPISVNYPFNGEYLYKVVLPGGWNVDTESKELRRKGYNFRSEYTEINDTLSLKYQFSFLQDHIPAEKLKEFASDVKLLKDEDLYYQIIYTPGSVSFYPNHWLIVISGGFVLLCIYVGFRIYSNPTAAVYSFNKPLPIRGWLIVAAISLAWQAYFAGRSLFGNTYFDLNHWHSYSSRELSTFYKFLISFEVFTYMFTGVCALFCLYLLLQRRDIFPRITTYYLIAASILVTGLNFITGMFYGEEYSSLTVVIRSVVMVIIWTQYFKTSERVRNTFTVPYVAKEYSGEEQHRLEEVEQEQAG